MAQAKISHTTYAQAPSTKDEKSGSLMKGIVIGAAVGAAVAMLDPKTRNRVTTATSDMKDQTMDMVTKVRENPEEVKTDVQARVQSASAVLKEAINEAKDLYERVNGDIVEQVKDVKEDSMDIVNQAQDLKEDVVDIGNKVAEAKDEVSSNSTKSKTNNNIPGEVGKDDI
ncbi:YtxH domain-containing protein [Alkalihalophilus pseudofirmus]|uniref:YtxH domain-containing protein n=1 Tax=Alkalihalophilus pseudofirmus TaxID=79885 RepID=UPI00259B22DE|nr:YtxH domain-containing protein [Alkalihalophilus pseudofirmus]WEG17891.1 YtxH domain-containing protein [Alkalihalophilus pseudofirmus]